MLSSERRSEILGVFLFCISILLFLALVTDGYQGSPRRPIEDISGVPNALGKPGAAVAGILYLIVGGGSHVLYVVFAVWGSLLLRHKPLDRLPWRLFGAALLTVAVGALLHVDITILKTAEPYGGVLGGFFGTLSYSTFGVVGSNVLWTTLGIVGTLLSTEFLFVRLLDRLGGLVVLMLHATYLGLIHLGKRLSSSPDTVAEAAPTAAKGRKGTAPAAKEYPFEEPPIVVAPFTGYNDSAGLAMSPHTTAISHPGHITRKMPELPLPEPEMVPATSGYDETVPEPPREPIRIHPSPRATDSLVESAAPASKESKSSKKARAATPAEPVSEAPAETPDLEEPVVADVVPYEARTSSKAKAAPMPRRKSVIMDELPDDYEYPKRYTKPSLEIFEVAEQTEEEDWSEQLLATSALLEQTLLTFGIEARVTDVTRGPTITRFELEPAPGIKVARFQTLADDIALALKAHRVRVEAPIPGKGRVGIEVPNKHREAVTIRELLESKKFSKAKGILNLALGKDIAGDPTVVDLTTMPHLLVAGATGAGKTVCVKTLLASVLCAKTPEELQLMLIDPKMVELSIFNDIPHLITPVVIDPKKAAHALNWLIVEMEERYRLFAHLRVRNIEVYNESVDNGEIEMVGDDGTGGSVESIRKLPYIVCIIDELADLMMLARAEVEDAIARLAQLARAVGIHLIIATQRPSVDVLTGVIKANFPARMSFQVSSRVDSRCILDEIGAERLIGRGDMLYLPAGQSKPTRIQGAFVSDEEMNRLIAYLKTQAPPQYRDEIEKFGKKDQLDDLADQDDDLFDEAVRVVLESGQASISMVQRRLRVGYTRAARLIDMMEIRGIVGPHMGSKAREILVDAPPKNEVA
ncbi:MAG: hypothetical protein AMXMBFR84_00660 [Candidatus Hydrogenedentota bacterium]